MFLALPVGIVDIVYKDRVVETYKQHFQVHHIAQAFNWHYG